MYSFLVLLFVLTSVLLVIVILLQAGKGQGLAGSFGGIGGGGAVFGGRGAASFLSKTTAVLAVVYGVLCLSIGYISRSNIEQSQQSLIQQQAEQQAQMPATDLLEAPLTLPVGSDSTR
jgi:preprotein translocase subunit SecG